MKNHSSCTQWLDEIMSVEMQGGVIVTIDLGHNTLLMMEKPLEIKVGDNKVKVTTLEFLQAFKDMLDTGVFEMDQIDSAVWDIEKKLKDLSGRNDYLNAAIREIKGGY